MVTGFYEDINADVSVIKDLVVNQDLAQLMYVLMKQVVQIRGRRMQEKIYQK